MALKSLSSLLMFALLLTVCTAFGGRKILSSPDFDASAPSPVPEFDVTRLDTTAPDVIDIAKFAVDQINKENNLRLAYSSVVEALLAWDSTDVIYNLIVATKVDDGTNNSNLNDYSVIVSSGTKSYKLIAFGEIKL